MIAGSVSLNIREVDVWGTAPSCCALPPREDSALHLGTTKLYFLHDHCFCCTWLPQRGCTQPLTAALHPSAGLEKKGR
jgi:hypothetical protein